MGKLVFVECISVVGKNNTKGHCKILLTKWEQQRQRPCGTFRSKSELKD